MKRLNPTDIITAALIEAAFADLGNSDLGDPPPTRRTAENSVVGKTRVSRDELSPGFRRVHIEGNGTEREPIDGEPYMVIERVYDKGGDFETTIMRANDANQHQCRFFIGIGR
jgi:hypothetical protein